MTNLPIEIVQNLLKRGLCGAYSLVQIFVDLIYCLSIICLFRRGGEKSPEKVISNEEEEFVDGGYRIGTLISEKTEYGRGRE